MSRTPDCSAQDAVAEQRELGRQLFMREWKPGESLASGGDGLGPSFNDVSCVACHRLGAVGGGGGIDNNVSMLSVPIPRAMPTWGQARQLRDFHPAFLTGDGDLFTSIVVQKSNLGGPFELNRAELFRAVRFTANTMQQREQAEQLHAREPVQLSQHGDWPMARHQRNTPALFGDGLIDAISEAAIRQLAALQARQVPQVAGRVAPTDNGAGKFGWRGQTAMLADFVRGACANELGLEVPGANQALNPNDPKYRPAGLDLDLNQLAAMVAFVRALPAPRRIESPALEQREIVRAGNQAFQQIGCANCHVERVGQVSGIFSDLLLHDMGPALADPAQAAPRTVTQSRPAIGQERSLPEERAAQPNPQSGRLHLSSLDGPQVKSVMTSAGYYSPSREIQIPRNVSRVGNEIVVRLKVPSNLEQEWRTPPLWGVADSAPYLHDGRAPTLVEAIALHGGQGQASADQFLLLPPTTRLAVLEFLATLRAPDIRQ